MRCALTRKQKSELSEVIKDFAEAKAALANLLDEIASDWEDQFHESSERWQESDAGQEAQGRKDTMRERVEEVENIDIDLEEFLS